MGGELKESLKKLFDNEDEVYSLIGEVISIDEDNRTCDVQPLNDDAIIYDVRLQSSIKQTVGLVLWPKMKSKVIVTFIGRELAYVAMTDEVDAMTLKTTHDFAEEMNNFIDIINSTLGILKQFKLTTNMGPTIAVMPDVLLKISEQEQKLASFKTNLNTIIK